MRALKMLGGVALGCALAAAGGAAAASTLNWSYSTTGVGSCDLHTAGGCSPSHPPVYTKQTIQFGNNMNAASSASDPAWGSAHGSANPGAGPLTLPELHSDVAGVPSGPGAPYAWDYSQVQGVMGLKATSAFSLNLHDFVGALDYTMTGPGVGIVSASLAILSGAAGNPAVGATWFTKDATYGFANDCTAKAALGIGETGYKYAKGVNLTSIVAPTLCGASTVNLDAGDVIYLWARMQTFEAGFGTTDASHTFKVELAPGLSADTVSVLTHDLTPLGRFGAVPEPTTWAMLLVGLGGVGGLIRARRRTLAAA